MNWNVGNKDSVIVDCISKDLAISPALAFLLINLGLDASESACRFLKPKLEHLSDPFEVSNLKLGVERLSKAIDAKEKVFIFGDYDVDGITSIVQLVSILRRYDLDPSYCVPLRLSEGYGLTKEAIDRALNGGVPDLMIVVDCGTNSKESIDYLYGLGVSVIIIDHHQQSTEPLDQGILINPHVNDPQGEAQGWFNLSASGLVFKFLHGFIKYRREQNDALAQSIRLSQIIDLAGMGTIADLVPLHGENRILSWYGLRHLQNNKRLGIMTLLRESNVEAGQSLNGSDISYRIAPRINACGRLGDASLPVELLLSEDRGFAQKTAKKLDTINAERQSIERAITEEAEVVIQKDSLERLGFVLSSEEWHPGVVGIVASRVSRKFNKPCIVLGREGELAKGSGRSISGVDLVSVIEPCNDLLNTWGGHPMAVGLSLPWEDRHLLQEAFEKNLALLYPDGFPEPQLEIACWLEAHELNEALLNDLSTLQPYGQNNPEPVFGLKGIVFNKAAKQFGKTHKRFFLPLENEQNEPIEGIAWNTDKMPIVGEPVDLAFRLEWNFWRNKKTFRLTLVDWKQSLN